MMVLPLHIWIPGRPVPQGRPRAYSARGKARVYSPKRSTDWRTAAAFEMRQALAGRAWPPIPSAPFFGVEVLAIFPCPKGEQRKRYPTPRRWYGRRGGDADNIAKAVLDAGNGVLWQDDALVVDLRCQTILGAQGEDPGVEVEVWPIGEDYEGE